MYKIIGGDQNEYGPVAAGDVRRWIAEGRLNGRSRVKGDGDADWKPLGQFPEFAAALSAHTEAPPPLGGPAAPPSNPEVWTSEMLAREPYLPVGECLARGWELTRNNFGLLLGASALVWAPSVAKLVPVVDLAYNVLAGVLYGGLCRVVLKRIRGEPAAAREVFDGFNLAFGQLVLVGMILWVLTSLGLCACLLPGIFLFVAWIFAVPLVIDKRLEFWSAMELSRKVVIRIWFPVFLLLVLAFLPLAFVTLVTQLKLGSQVFSLVQDSIKSAPQDFGRALERGIKIYTSTLGLQFVPRLVLLFNLPFAMAALMYAYETLFGPRPTANA